ncbi:hypothetical protein SLOPH_1100 [Spraguea lophii 42_110]|uniref:Uncharacterized protein n=1 Tax=Spraguea lophii (strain 42_110) TaxID=1358809 RepID=S7XHN5_SPRLO|nr:hypothetical protein SLOPH_1100 [Spraguea lophii 42_110]
MFICYMDYILLFLDYKSINTCERIFDINNYNDDRRYNEDDVIYNSDEFYYYYLHRNCSIRPGCGITDNTNDFINNFICNKHIKNKIEYDINKGIIDSMSYLLLFYKDINCGMEIINILYFINYLLEHRDNDVVMNIIDRIYNYDGFNKFVFIINILYFMREMKIFDIQGNIIFYNGKIFYSCNEIECYIISLLYGGNKINNMYDEFNNIDYKYKSMISRVKGGKRLNVKYPLFVSGRYII